MSMETKTPRTARSHRKSQAGFTLVELLIFVGLALGIGFFLGALLTGRDPKVIFKFTVFPTPDSYCIGDPGTPFEVLASAWHDSTGGVTLDNQTVSFRAEPTNVRFDPSDPQRTNPDGEVRVSAVATSIATQKNTIIATLKLDNGESFEHKAGPYEVDPDCSA